MEGNGDGSFVPSKTKPQIIYSGTRLESKLLVFFGFSVCSHVYLLNYQNWLKSGDKTQIPSMITIIPKKITNSMEKKKKDLM